MYNNREEVEGKEKQKEKLKDKRQNAAILAAAFAQAQTPSQGRSFPKGQGRRRGYRVRGNLGDGIPLRRDQCAICRGKGHWKNECPKRQSDHWKPQSASVPEADLLMIGTEDSD